MKTWILALAATTVACGTSQPRLHYPLFSTDWEDDKGASIGRAWQRVAGTPIASPPGALVVGVDGKGQGLRGLALADQHGWTFTHAIDSRPTIAANVVVASGGGEVFALDASSGQLIWRRPAAGLTLVGAGDDGATTVVTLRQAGAVGSVVWAVGHDGQLLREFDTEKTLGTPAVVGRTLFVPWAGEYVSVLDVPTGNEVARVTLRNETSRAWTEAGALWFGEVAFTRFDEKIHDASKGAATTAALPPPGDLPGTPKIMEPGTSPLPLAATADDKARLYARPVAGDDGAGLANGRYYATYFRLVMGFDSTGNKLSWSHLHAADVVGGAAGFGGVVLCDAQGKVVTLDAANGGVRSQGDLGGPVSVCVVTAGVARLDVDGPSDAKPFVAQLEEAVTVDDPMLVSGQRFLLRELAVAEDPSATKTLVDLASDPRTSPDLLADAREALAKRRNGQSYMVAALQRHYDYLKDVLRTPPVGPIAQALAAIKETTAASLLADHLLDPADTEDDTKQAAAALVVLAGPQELPAMRQFFGMYRATADDDDIADALVSVGRAMIGLHDKEGQAAVETAASDPMTAPYARDRLVSLVSRTEAPAAHPSQAPSAGD
jgi:outer membrane protein assembly factor BamB